MTDNDLQNLQMSSAYVMSLDPGKDKIDHKLALETGMAILLGKPIMVIVQPGQEPTPGLARVAHVVCRLTSPLTTMAGQAELQAAMNKMHEMLDGEDLMEPWMRGVNMAEGEK